jgi:hypothetical protein
MTAIYGLHIRESELDAFAFPIGSLSRMRSARTDRSSKTMLAGSSGGEELNRDTAAAEARDVFTGFFGTIEIVP